MEGWCTIEQNNIIMTTCISFIFEDQCAATLVKYAYCICTEVCTIHSSNLLFDGMGMYVLVLLGIDNLVWMKGAPRIE